MYRAQELRYFRVLTCILPEKLMGFCLMIEASIKWDCPTLFKPEQLQRKWSMAVH